MAELFELLSSGAHDGFEKVVERSAGPYSRAGIDAAVLVLGSGLETVQTRVAGQLAASRSMRRAVCAARAKESGSREFELGWRAAWSSGQAVQTTSAFRPFVWDVATQWAMAPKQRSKVYASAPAAGRPVFDEPERIPGIPMKAPVPKFPKKAPSSARRAPTAEERRKTAEDAEKRARAELDAEVAARLAEADAMKVALADAARSIRAVLAKGLAPREPGQAKPGGRIIRESSKENRGANVVGTEETPEERNAPLLAKFRRAQADRAEQDKVIAAMRGLLRRAGATPEMIDRAVDRELFPGVENPSDESVVAPGSSRELLMREVRRLRAREKAASGVVTAKTGGPRAPGGGGSFEARSRLAAVAAALEDVANGRAPAASRPSEHPGTLGTLGTVGTVAAPPPIALASPRMPPPPPIAIPPPSPSPSVLSDIDGAAAMDALERRLGRQLEHQARMIEATTRQLEAQHREDTARLEREAKARAEEVKRARRESEQLVAETAERVVDVARRSLPQTPVPTPRGRDIGAREEPGGDGGARGDKASDKAADKAATKMNERMAEVIDDLVDELRLGAETAAERDESRKQEHALVAKRLEEVTKSHSMNLKAAKADIARVTRDEIAKLDKVNEERARDLAATVLASEQVLSIRVEEGVERNASEVKAAVEAARAKEEAARAKDIADVAEKIDEAASAATARAASLERELAAALERLELELVGARGETAKIRREFEETAHTRAETRVAAAEASAAVREVAKLQKRLLAAQVDARLGWRETQRLHAARMENMAAKLVEYTSRERRLSDELHERGVQLELERREHARLRGMHAEMWKETSVARRGRYEAELAASTAAEAAAAARDAAVREISKSRDVALAEMARLRAHYESIAAANPKAQGKAEAATVVEALNAELAEALRQRRSVEGDLQDALRRLRLHAADLVASRREILSLREALERSGAAGDGDGGDVAASDASRQSRPVEPVRSGEPLTPREFDAPPVMFQTPPAVYPTSRGSIAIVDEDEASETSETSEGSPEMRAMLKASAEARERLEALTRLRFDEVPLSPK